MIQRGPGGPRGGAWPQQPDFRDTANRKRQSPFGWKWERSERGHFDSVVQGNDWSDAPGSRGTQVRPLILRLAGTDGHEAHSSRGERLAHFGIWFGILGIHGCFGETFQVGPGRRWLNCGAPGSRSKCSFPELFKWREFRTFFKSDLWEDFMAWGSGKAEEGLKPWPSV